MADFVFQNILKLVQKEDFFWNFSVEQNLCIKFEQLVSILEKKIMESFETYSGMLSNICG